MTTTTISVTDQILEQVTELLEIVSRYHAESRISYSMHVLPISDNDDSENLLIAIGALEKGPISDLLSRYPSIDSVRISGLGALIGMRSGTVNVTVTYARPR